jgi:NADH dehydrogenase
VEMAGPDTPELSHPDTAAPSSGESPPGRVREILLDAAPSVLGDVRSTARGPRPQGPAGRDRRLEVQQGAKVVAVERHRTSTSRMPRGRRRRIESVCKVWAGR